MAKLLNPLNKCIITNKILSIVNNEDIVAGERITIVIDTKKNGDIKNLTVKKGESHEV